MIISPPVPFVVPAQTRARLRLNELLALFMAVPLSAYTHPMAETSLQKFMKAFPSQHRAPSSAPPSTAPNNNEVMGSFFLINPITMPFANQTPTPSITTTVKAAAPKVLPDREIYVARYGKIYKRKAPSPMNGIKMNSPPGCQYCKLCDTHKPMVAFYTATKRYVCRSCHANRVARRLKERLRESVAERRSMDAWTRLCFDRIWFGYTKLQFDSTTIKDIITSADIPWELCPCACPIDPSLPMRPRNVAILSRTAYQLVLQLWKHSCSRGIYIMFVQRCNLVPPRFDVAFPSHPYGDEAYVRPLIDVAPILLEEQTNVVVAVQTADHTSMEFLKNRDVDPFESIIRSQELYARTVVPRLKA